MKKKSQKSLLCFVIVNLNIRREKMRLRLERERERERVENWKAACLSMPTTLNNVIGFFFIGLEGVFF